MTFEKADFEYHGDTFYIGGKAVFDVEIDRFFDADMGGFDGVDVARFELLHVLFDGFKFTRDMFCIAAGNPAVLRMEDAILDANRQDILETE